MLSMIRSERDLDELALLHETLQAWADRLSRLDDMCHLVGHLAATTKEEILWELESHLEEVRGEYEKAFGAYESLKEQMETKYRRHGG